MARIAIVDDSPITRQMLKLMLERAGHQVVAFMDNGRDAVLRVPAYQADVLLLDMLLPQLDGVEVLERLKRQGALPPTIVLSSVTSIEKVRAACDAGAAAYMLKPFDADHLLEAVAHLLAMPPRDGQMSPETRGF